jgi:hypothetical protein
MESKKTEWPGITIMAFRDHNIGFQEVEADEWTPIASTVPK